MFAGSASGAGKSTLAAAVARDLEAPNRRVRLLSEDDLLEMGSFARFERRLGPTDPETHRADEALIEAARALVEDELAARQRAAGASSHVLLTDALLPGFFWLFGRYDPDRVRGVAERLAEVAAPVDPLLVYLRGDPAALVARAAAERGADWPSRMVGSVSRWRVPHYPEAAASTLDDVLRFWAWLDAQTVALVAEWPVETLILDAGEPLPSLQAAVLSRCRGR
jgi:hypothetical protein